MAKTTKRAPVVPEIVSGAEAVTGLASPPGPGRRERAEPTRISRIPILDLAPQLADNLWPAKAYVGEAVPFKATAFREGHDLIGVTLLLTDPDGTRSEHPMLPGAPGTDRWITLVTLDRQGIWHYRVRAWADNWATWRHTAVIKVPAGIDVELTFLEGSVLLAAAGTDKRRPAAERRAFARTAADLVNPGIPVDDRLALLDTPSLNAFISARPLAGLSSTSAQRAVRVERTRAGVGSWYEFFPRSEGAVRRADHSWQSGTFRTAEDRLPGVAAMGFDVLYLPPIHPIGHSYRKGPNNTLGAGPNDPGSPWAIGSAEGGHDAIHPDLGTVDDFRHFLAAAAENNLEVALDLALQASPDHPWVTEHPEWFTTLPDGSIAYAENPPKKYQDIYPINFDNDPAGIRAEVLRIVRHWMSLGVRIFRVDNPHTKPLDFWEWLINRVTAENPDVIFLAEAFTRPALMQALGKVGFQQSYSYFTWRNTKTELEEFFHGLATTTADFYRPNLFVNTPDILSEFLQVGGNAAFKIRAALAATAAPTWGMYAGFELFESVPRPGAEENIDNEKYEYRPRDFAAAEAAGESLAPYVSLLNAIRRAHPALGQLRNLDLHASDDGAVLVYSKYLDAAHTGTGRSDAIIVVVNVDPHSVRETIVRLDVTRFGLEPGTVFEVEELITGAIWTWTADNFVRLDAGTEPVHILHVRGAVR